MDAVYLILGDSSATSCMRRETEKRCSPVNRENSMATRQEHLIDQQRNLPFQQPTPNTPSWSSLPAELRQHILYYIFDSFMYPAQGQRISAVVNRRLSTSLLRMSAISRSFEQSDLIPALEQYSRMLVTEREARAAEGFVSVTSMEWDKPEGMRKMNLDVQLDTVRHFLHFKKLQNGPDPNISFI